MGFLEFLKLNYIWILVVLILLIITIIGFFADRRDKKKKKEKEQRKKVRRKINSHVKREKVNSPKNRKNRVRYSF